MSEDVEAVVRAEVERLHVFFVDWFRGTLPAGEETLQQGVGRVFHPRFTMIAPSCKLFTREALLAGLAGGHGTNPAFGITIHDVRVVDARDGLVVATYEERQSGARNSEQADNARRSTAIFVQGPEGLLWRHLHESWIPR